MAAKKKSPSSEFNWQQISSWLMGGSLASVILAGVGYFGQDIWLASTQWLIIAAVLAAFGIYTKLEKK